MRKIVVYIATSADGFIARPDGSVDRVDRTRLGGRTGRGSGELEWAIFAVTLGLSVAFLMLARIEWRRAAIQVS